MNDAHNPCSRDCPDRSAGCHGTCEKYAEWSAEHNRQREEQHRLKYVNLQLARHVNDKWDKWWRNRHS